MVNCTKEAKQNAVAIAKGSMTYEEASASLGHLNLSAKATQVALKGLAIAGNMVANMAIMWVVSKGIELFSDWINRVENAKKNAEEFTTTLKDSQKTQSENSSTISSLNDEYKELSKGVNALGENVSLTSNEYARYHEITNQVAGIMPDLVSGYDAQGNAILKVRGNLANLNEEYEKCQRQEAIKLIKDEKSKDIFSNFRNKTTEVIDNSTGFKFLAPDANAEDLISDIYEMKKLAKMSQDELEQNFDNYYSYLEPFNFEIGMTEDEFETFRGKLQTELDSITNEIETATSSIDYYATNFAKSIKKFWQLDESSQTHVNKFLGNMSYKFINYNGLDNKETLEDFVIQYVNAMNSNKGGISDAFTDLFELDIDKLDPASAQKKVTSYIKSIAKVLDIKETNLPELKESLGFEDVDELAKSYTQTLNNTKKQYGKDLTSFFEENSINTQEEIDSWIKITRTTNDAAEAKKKYLALGGKSFDDWNSMFDDVKIGKADSSNKLSKRYKNVSEQLKKEKLEAERVGADLNKTIYGNIDLNNRQRLKWNEGNLKKYGNAIASWYDKAAQEEYKTVDDFVNHYLNSYSTVDGRSESFDGLEIAFTPMLQTKDGAVYLDSSTVHTYIESLMSEVGKGGKAWTTEDLLKLDAKGLDGFEVDGYKVKGLIADIGNTARKTGETMHYLGKDGSIADFANNLEKEVKKSAKSAGMSLNDYASIVQLANERHLSLNDCLNIFASSSYYSQISSLVGAVSDYSTAIENAKKSTEALQTALTEQNNQGYLTQETYKALIDLDADYSNCLEYSSGYMVLNIEKVNEMAKAKSEAILAELEFKEALDVKQYNENTSAIERNKERINELRASKDSSSDAIQSEISVLEEQNKSLLSNNDGLQSNIEQYDMLESNIRGATSAYQEFLDALSNGNDGDRYNKMVGGLEDLNELYKSGGLESTKGKALTEAYFGEDFKTSNYKEALKNVKKYLTEDANGYNQFLKDLVSTGNATEKDGEISIKSTKEKIKKDLGLTDALLEAMADISKFYGHELKFESSTDGVNDLTNATNQTKDAIKQMQAAIDAQNKVGIDTTEQQRQLDAFKEKVNQTKISVIEDITSMADGSQGAFDKFKNSINLTNNPFDKYGIEELTPEQLEKAQKNKNNEASNKFLQEIAQNGGDASVAVENLGTNIQNLNTIKVNDLGFKGINKLLDSTKNTLTDIDSKFNSLNGKKVTIDVKTTTNNGENSNKGHKGGESDAIGTYGNAFAKGTAKKSSLALVGEEGQELISRNGRYFTVGDHGAEFAYIKKGDIVFNAEQTRQLFNTGSINSRGKSYATGTAYASNDKITGNASLVTSKGNRQGTSNKSSSKKNSKKTKEKSKQTFDWIEKRLDYLANKTQKTIDKINNYIKQGTKNKYYTTLLNNIDDEIKANDKAAKKYQQKANTVTFSKNKAKDKAFKKKIRTGAIDGSYKQLIQDYGEKTATKIENYRNWTEKSENAKKTASQKRQEKREKTREALDSRIEDLNNQLDQIKNTADGYQHKIDLQEANGLTPTKKTYNNLITNAQDQISNLEAQNKELSNYQKGLKKNSVEWYDIQKQINENNSSIQDLTKSQAEWNAEIRKLPLNVIQSMIDLLDSAKSSFESLLNLKKQINKHISSKDVEKQINFEKENMQLSASKIQELAKGDLDKALTEEGLNKSQKQLYTNYLRQLSEGEISEKQFFESIGKLGISKEDYNRNTLLKDTTQSMLSEYSSWLESANNIDQTAESYIDTQIDKLQEERDLLKEINDAKSKALELEKKQQKLQEAKQNKTNLIYHEGFGFNYEEDNTAVNEAQNELDDYNFELNQDQYDEAIKVLEEIRDKESYVTLDQDGNVLTPDWDNWVKKIVDSLNSKNFTFNLVQDSAGNITTTPKYAKGTMSAKGGMSIVGENGIEMRLLNQGDAILPHDVTENLWDFGLNPQQMIMDNLKLPDYSGLIKPRAVEQNKVVHIQNVTLPNINDLSKAQELFDGLMTINSDATQRAWKH